MDRALLETLSALTDEERQLLASPGQWSPAAYGAHASPLLQVDAKRLLTGGRLLHIRPHTRFVHFPPHTHNYIEMVYMCAGETRHIVNGTPLRLHTGEILLLSPHAVQEILPASAGDIAVNFILLPALFHRAPEMLNMEQNRVVDFLADCLSLDSDTAGYLHFAVADILPVQNLLENLIFTLLHDEPNRRGIREATMRLLLVQLANHIDRLVGENTAPQRFSAAVLQYIETHYRDGSLTELAGTLALQPGTLSKRITRCFGCTFQTLLQEKRLQKAALLLRSTAMSVADIILTAGYENSSYFFRIFRKKYGMSPAAYRAAARKLQKEPPAVE